MLAVAPSVATMPACALRAALVTGFMALAAVVEVDAAAVDVDTVPVDGE